MLAFYPSALESDEDKITFERLYTEHKALALRVAFRVTRNEALAEDAVHDAFAKVIAGWEKFLLVPCNKRRSRIVIIVRNSAIDIMRKERGLNFEKLDKNLPSDDVGLDAVLERQSNSEYIRRCIDQIPEIYKAVLILRFFQDLSNGETADVLGISANAVGVRILRAKAMLKTILEKGDGLK
jgi:RNA polymerase sigma-70 factor (ECF subfamily)